MKAEQTWTPEPQPPCTDTCCTGADPCQSTTQTCTPEERCDYCTIPAITREWLARASSDPTRKATT